MFSIYMHVNINIYKKKSNNNIYNASIYFPQSEYLQFILEIPPVQWIVGNWIYWIIHSNFRGAAERIPIELYFSCETGSNTRLVKKYEVIFIVKVKILFNLLYYSLN